MKKTNTNTNSNSNINSNSNSSLSLDDEINNAIENNEYWKISNISNIDVNNNTWDKIKSNCHAKFKDIIATLIFDWNWKWLDWIIVQLCYLEVYIKLMRDSELYETVKVVYFDKTFPIEGNKPLYEEIIPEKTFYCEGCPFAVISEVASFFYGEQSCGFCYFLGKGDFSLKSATQLLWDGCKECNVNEDIDDIEDIDDLDDISDIEDIKEYLQ